MTRSRRILLFAIAALLLAAIGWHLYATREPSYQGKTLTEWLEQLYVAALGSGGEEKQPTEAIRAIGKAGLPTLLRLTQSQTSPFKEKLEAWAKKQTLVKVHFRSASRSYILGYVGFQTLGSEGRDAVPALAAMLQDMNVTWPAAQCLGAIGQEGIPILRSGLRSQNEWMRACCLGGLSSSGTNGWAALPEVLQCLKETNQAMRINAAVCLGRFQHDPATVLPALWQVAQQDQDASVRERSIEAMGLFSNQASAYVPSLQKMLFNANTDNIPLRQALTNALQNIDPTAWPKAGALPVGGSPNTPP